jgi:hypothetical protein
MGIGERIGWMTVNGSASGVVVGEHPCGWMVRMESGKEVVVYDWEVVQRHTKKEEIKSNEQWKVG